MDINKIDVICGQLIIIYINFLCKFVREFNIQIK